MKNKSFLYLIIAVGLSLIVALRSEAAINVTAKVDRTRVALTEQIKLTISVTGNLRVVSDPRLPGLDSFETYSAGRSSSISIINGQMSSSTIFTYILVPQKTGEFTLDKIEVNNSIYQIEPIKIIINKGATQSQ